MATEDKDEFERRDSMWERLLFGLLLLFMFAVAETLLWAVTIAQFFWMVFAGRPNDHISEFGARLGVWVKRSVFYLSGTSEEKPFPWREID